MPKIIVPAPADTAFPTPLVLDCNGITKAIPYGVAIDVDPEFIEVLANSTHKFELVAPEAAAAGEPGGEAGGSASDSAEPGDEGNGNAASSPAETPAVPPALSAKPAGKRGKAKPTVQ